MKKTNYSNTFSANRNSTEVSMIFSSLKKYGDNKEMLTNLKVMVELKDQMHAKGILNKSSFEYQIIEDLIIKARTIYMKDNKSTDDIFSFYAAYDNVNELVQKESGKV